MNSLRKIKEEFMNLLKETVYFGGWFLHFIMHRKTKRYDNRNEKIILVGNGLSAKNFLLKNKCTDYKYCCVNYFALDEELFRSIKPGYYCIIDPMFFKKEYFMKEKKAADVLKQLGKVNWNMKIICYSGCKLPLNNQWIEYHYINENYFGGSVNHIKMHLFDCNMANCGFQNVIVAALFYFVMSNAKSIILTGVENNWHNELIVDENNNVLRNDTHFYGKQLLNLTEKGEIKKGEIYKYFQFYYLTLYEYSIISEYAKRKGISVINSCRDSFIDVFEKRNFKE